MQRSSWASSCWWLLTLRVACNNLLDFYRRLLTFLRWVQSSLWWALMLLIRKRELSHLGWIAFSFQGCIWVNCFIPWSTFLDGVAFWFAFGGCTPLRLTWLLTCLQLWLRSHLLSSAILSFWPAIFRRIYFIFRWRRLPELLALLRELLMYKFHQSVMEDLLFNNDHLDQSQPLNTVSVIWLIKSSIKIGQRVLF